MGLPVSDLFMFSYKSSYCLFQLQKLLRYLDTVCFSHPASYLNSLLLLAASSICDHDGKLQLVALLSDYYYQYLA